MQISVLKNWFYGRNSILAPLYSTEKLMFTLGTTFSFPSFPSWWNDQKMTKCYQTQFRLTKASAIGDSNVRKIRKKTSFDFSNMAPNIAREISVFVTIELQFHFVSHIVYFIYISVYLISFFTKQKWQITLHLALKITTTRERGNI